MTVVRQQRWLPAATATALVGAIAITAACGAPATSQQGSATVQKTVFSKDTAERATDLDLGKKGPSTGDRIVTRGPFFDANDTERKVGSYTGELVNINPETLLTQMTATVTFRDGQLTLVGSLPFERTLSEAGAILPITGGTGAYAHATGTATMHARTIGQDEGFLFTFDIARE